MFIDSFKNLKTYLIHYLIFDSFYNLKLPYLPGAAVPLTACRRHVIAFKWPRLRLPRKIPEAPLVSRFRWLILNDFGQEARSTKGGLVRRSPRGGSGGRSPRTREVFKCFKNTMKNVHFLIETLPFLQNSFKILSILYGKFGQKFRKI